ncbi:hypothetical protein BC830DRAFT_1255196 [Chytriomyces sp. MP71]|nr:hypothetical protein BC830DRAFT_1255196 [Chytriomyces sp. MP71]
MSHSHTLKRLERIKTVGLWGGVCLLFNSMSGPAIPYTATVFQTLGVLIPFVLFLLFAVVSAFAVLFIVEAMQAIPGNKHFQGTVEFATLINFYFPAWGHILAQVILYGAIQSQAIQSVVLVSQAVDGIFVDIFKHSCGLTQTFQWRCIDNSSGGLFPNSMLFTLGFLATLVMCIPLARSKMDDNISVQVVAFCVTLLVVADWFTESLFDFQKKRVPFLKFEPAFGVLIGPVILNFSCAMFAPSWVNLKRKSINTQRTIWITMAMAIVIFGIVGLMPAYGFDGLGIKSLTDNSVNLLTILTNQSNTRLHLVANKVFCYIFNFSMLWPSIPFGCIVSETNIVQNFESKSRWFRPGVQFLCYVLPWFLAIPLLTGPLLGTIQNWCSILLAGPANFIIPFLVYLRCLNFRKEYNEHRSKLVFLFVWSPSIDRGYPQPFLKSNGKSSWMCTKNPLASTRTSTA